MNIIDHLSVGVPSIDDARKFYDAVMASIDCACLAATDGFAAYGNGSVQFLIMLPNDGQAATVGNGVHICFVAPSKEAVDVFHATAVKAGGECAGEPGPRPDYPMPNVYTGFVRDPYGNKLEVVHGGFAS